MKCFYRSFITKEKVLGKRLFLLIFMMNIHKDIISHYWFLLIEIILISTYYLKQIKII